MSSPDRSAPGPHLPQAGALALLEWQIAMGADEAIGEIAPNRLAPPPPAAALPAAAIPVPRPPSSVLRGRWPSRWPRRRNRRGGWRPAPPRSRRWRRWLRALTNAR